MKKNVSVNVNVHFTQAEAKVLRDKMETMFGEVNTALLHFPRRAERLAAFTALDKLAVAIKKATVAKPKKRKVAAKPAAAAKVPSTKAKKVHIPPPPANTGPGHLGV